MLRAQVEDCVAHGNVDDAFIMISVEEGIEILEEIDNLRKAQDHNMKVMARWMGAL